MIEKDLYIDEVEPLMFFGSNNSNFKHLQKHFTKLKLIARGNRIKVSGDAIEIGKFEQKVLLIQKYLLKYNSINQDVIQQLLTDQGASIIHETKDNEDVIVYGSSGKPIRARNSNQKTLVDHYHTSDLLFAIGPAGTGKTYIAIALAVQAFKNKLVKRIILSRPAVEAGEHLGFLPGDMKDKLDPYLQPLYDALLEMIPPKKLSDLFEDGVIQIAPLAFMRGRTLSNAFVILDEAQNATTKQLKMFLTRMGENSKFIITGDITQIDLPHKAQSGLVYASKVLKNIEGISIIHFDPNDIIRHRLVRQIVDAYEKADEQEKEASFDKNKTSPDKDITNNKE
jgi:phosphate starvation-inducible PhoH-like protein